MGVMIQVRNVPEPVHRKLKARAAMAGLSMSDYILAELRRSVERPTLEELIERVRGRAPVKAPVNAAEIIRRERESR